VLFALHAELVSLGRGEGVSSSGGGSHLRPLIVRKGYLRCNELGVREVLYRDLMCCNVRINLLFELDKSGHNSQLTG
jgi:hypothetical protein